MRTVNGLVFILRPYGRGFLETLGKCSRFAMPGLGFQVPITYLIRIRDVREHTMEIDPQAVTTKDNVEMKADGIMRARPTIERRGIGKPNCMPQVQHFDIQ